MLLGALMVLVPAGAGAEDEVPQFPEGTIELPAGGGSVEICHATNADTNPYIVNTPNFSATGEFTGANHASHTGPVWSAGLKAQRISWGDIIPPIAVDGVLYFEGSANWTDGMEIYANGCQLPGEEGDPPVVIVEKDVPGDDDDPTKFSFTVNDGESTPIDETEFIETAVAAGTVDVTEAEAVGYSLTDVACTRDYVSEGEPVEDEAIEGEWNGEGRTATFDAEDGDIITCTFTNTVDQQPNPSITVAKTNNADGTGGYSESEVAQAAGASVPFQVVISNTGDTDLTLATLTDTWADLETPIDLLTQESLTCTRPGESGPESVALADGSGLPAGSVTTCTFTLTGYAPAAGGSKTNTVVVTTDEQVNGQDTSTVTTPGSQIIVTPTPPTYTLGVDKLNDANGDGEFSDGENAVAEGDDVTFQVTIRNTGTGALTLSSLTDSFDGEVVDLLASGAGLDCGSVTLGVGSVLAPGSATTCTFVLEDYAPAGGEDRVNVISVDTDQTTPSTDDSTVSTPQVLSEEKEPTTTTTTTEPPPSTTVPPTTAKPPAVQGVQVTRTLPRTGNEARDLAGLGAALIGLGAALVVGGRRREDFAS